MIALDDLRAFAREAFGQCRLTDAAEAASAILAMGGADDFLFAGLIHDTAGRIADGLRVLRDGLSLYPDNASLHENLAVLLLRGGDTGLAIEAFQTAAALGSDSPNVHDGLCDAYQRIGRLDLAVEAGRRALRAKDRRFGGSVPLVAMPHGRPPPFRGGRPERNVIAYALWGDNPRYHVPLMENVRIRPHLFPDWSIRVYHDETVDPGYAAALAALGAQLQPMARSPGVPAHRALLWRFEVIADPDVERFLIRDANSLLTVKGQSRGRCVAAIGPPFPCDARLAYPHRSRAGGDVGRGWRDSAASRRFAAGFCAVAHRNRSPRSGFAQCDRLAGDPAQRADPRQHFSSVSG